MSSVPDRGVAADDERVEHLVRSMEDGGMTRETFIARAAAIGLSASGIGALLGGSVASAASRTMRGARVAAVKSTLSVVDVGSGTADTLDPHKQASPVDGMRITSLYDKLLVYNEHWEPQPWLAESVESSKDAKTWTVRLVSGATFHDGSPVTAADVKFTFEQILNPKVAAANADNFAFMKGARVKILDSRTIRYVLAQPFADVPAAFGDPSGVNILPHTWDSTKANTAPNGSGPFQFVSFTPGQESTMTKNPNYWKAGYPLVNQLSILSVPDESARVNSLLAGTVDLATNLDNSVITSVKAGGAQVIAIPGNGLAPIILAPDIAPYTWKDPRVREAFALAIDRKQIVDVVYSGYATVGNDQPIGPTYPNHPVGIPTRPRNIARAKQLLAAAGHPHGLTATLVTGNAGPGMVALATVVAQQAAEAGFNIKIDSWPASTYWSDVWLKKGFYVSNWSQRATPQLFLAETAYSNGIYNESHYRSKQVDKWLTEAVQTVTPAKRVKLYSEAMGAVAASAQWIIPAYASLIHCAVPGFKWKQLPPAQSDPYLFNASVTA